ncbi:hypothetical protein BD560DRAFT_392436 [Blakeslea trispora]|nr:hypothetical protein BD560DRAFT_392436 [Blakeslea trispora]
MSILTNQLRTKKAALVGAGVVILITACTLLTWKTTTYTKKEDHSKIKSRSIKKEEKAVAEQQKQSHTAEEDVLVEKKEEIVADKLDAQPDVALDTEIIMKAEDEKEVEKIVESSNTVKVEDQSIETSQQQLDDNVDAETKKDEASDSAMAPAQEDKVNVSSAVVEEQVVVAPVTAEDEKTSTAAKIDEIPVVAEEQIVATEDVVQVEESPVMIEEQVKDQTLKPKEESASPTLEESNDDREVNDTCTEKSESLATLVFDDSNHATASESASVIPLSSSLHATAPEFVPKIMQPTKKSAKKFLTREQLIEQQKQHYVPKSKARCSHWPHCTNNNCKFFHPFKECRAGDACFFGDKCMFVHPRDCTTPSRENSLRNKRSSSNTNNLHKGKNNNSPSNTVHENNMVIPTAVM